MTTPATQVGVILGTADLHVARNRRSGKAIDQRTDIWAFGCVLYECLTGRRVFHGETFGDVVASVVSGEPDWSALPPLPRRVHELLRRALTKDPQTRLRDMGEARVALELAQSETAEGDGTERRWPRSRRSPRRRRRRGARVGGGVGSVPALAPEDSGLVPDVRFEIVLPQGQNFGANYNRVVTISPDASTLAFIMSEGLWMRSLDRTEPRLVAGSEDARSPRSPTTADSSPSGTTVTSSAFRSMAVSRPSSRRCSNGRWGSTGPKTTTCMWAVPTAGFGERPPPAETSNRCSSSKRESMPTGPSSCLAASGSCSP